MRIHLSSGVNPVVSAGLARSFGRSQISPSPDGFAGGQVYVFDSADVDLRTLRAILGCNGTKIIIFGAIHRELANFFGVKAETITENLNSLSKTPAEDLSAGLIKYESHTLTSRMLGVPRYFERYDFTNEWNNLGYGKITTSGGVWGINQIVTDGDVIKIGQVYNGGRRLGTCAFLKDFDKGSALWFSRPAGLVDGHDWTIIEQFASNYRRDLPNIPYVSEMTADGELLVTMRLDCDEDITSSQGLFDLYKSEGVPFSLAVVSSLVTTVEQKDYLRAVAAQGSLISHSHTHPEYWGGSYERSFDEAATSRKILESITGKDILFAASPFHKNNYTNLKAIQDAGYKGLICGVIFNDPEYLYFRGGQSQHTDINMQLHSQQCMLHGDCYFRNPVDGLAVYKQRIELCRSTGSVFAFLDHPISKRYDYGWKSPDNQLRAHRDLISYLKRGGGVKFVDEDTCMNFQRDRINIRIEKRQGGFVAISGSNHSGMKPQVKLFDETVQWAAS